MVVSARKYNPGFLSDDELVASFCVRTSEFESIVGLLRECTGSSNPHQIVIGPRGSGKTSLLLRVAAELRRDAGLSSGFFPIVFAEESYEVATAGEFWLECLSRLAVQAPCREGDPDLSRTCEDLRTIQDDRILAERCLATLLDFSDREGKRLVLMVENLNMMFRDMADPDAGWRLRKILQTEPRIMLIASATSRFAEIDNPDHALYDLFRVVTLRPLNTNECAVLWETVSGRCPPPRTIRSLEILSGGSPRLLAIVARFGAERCFRELMADLLDLVDDHTEYFKSHIESLPAQERRVYLALAELWKPATTREVADRSRLETSKCSAQLTRLIDRGVVQVAGGSARRKQYYLSERLYNIYYLMRRSRGPDRLVEALVRFMESYYSPRELRDIGARIVNEAQSLGTEMRAMSRSALARMMDLPALAGYREELLAMIVHARTEAIDRGSVSPDVTNTESAVVRPKQDWTGRLHGDTQEPVERTVTALLDRAATLHSQNRTEDALAVYDELVSQFGKSEKPALLELVALALINKGTTFGRLSRLEDALVAYEEVVRRFGDSDAPALLETVAMALLNKGAVSRGLDKVTEALATYDEVVRRFGESDVPDLLKPVAIALLDKAATLDGLHRTADVLATYDEVVYRFGESDTPALLDRVAKALVIKSTILGGLNRQEDALAGCEEVVRRFGESDRPTLLDEVATALVYKGVTLGVLNRKEEALTACEEVIRRFGESERSTLLEQVAMALVHKGWALSDLHRSSEALAAYDEVVHRFGRGKRVVFPDQVVMALVSKGSALQILSRLEEALTTYDQVVRRFGEGEGPVVLDQVATAYLNKGLVLDDLSRKEEALTAYEEAIRRFGDGNTPILAEYAAKALTYKVFTLGELNRQEDVLAACDEMVRRFGDSRVPNVLELVAKTLFYKITILSWSERPEQVLVICDEMVQRFRASNIPMLVKWVAATLVQKGSTLERMDRLKEALNAYDDAMQLCRGSDTDEHFSPLAEALFRKGSVLAMLNRPQEALVVLDEVVHIRGEQDDPSALGLTAISLLEKGAILRVLNQPDEAIAVYGEVEHRIRKGEAFGLDVLVQNALLEKADLEFERGQYETAIGTASKALVQHCVDLPESRWRGYLIRAKAALASGDPIGCERDVGAALTLLTELDPLAKQNLETLMEFSIDLGPARMRELITASPAAGLLLPLTIALEGELGLESRVAREVAEVAWDIRQDLTKLRDARADPASTGKP